MAFAAKRNVVGLARALQAVGAGALSTWVDNLFTLAARASPALLRNHRAFSSILVVSVALLPACRRWTQVVPDPRKDLPPNYKAQNADLAILGAGRFVVVWVRGGLDNTRQGVFYRYAEPDADYLGPTEQLATGGSWVRALQGGPLKRTILCKSLKPNTEYRDLVGFEAQGAIHVAAFRHSCGTFHAPTVHTLGAGHRVALAVGSKGVLAVWQRNSDLVATWLDYNGAPVGSPVPLVGLAGEARSIDLIFDGIADQFVLGWIDNAGLLGGCATYWIGLSPGGMPIGQKHQEGTCDPERGHHTAMAYNPDPGVNPGGRFAWWHQYMPSTKRVWVHNSDGQVILGAELAVTETTPIANGTGLSEARLRLSYLAPVPTSTPFQTNLFFELDLFGFNDATSRWSSVRKHTVRLSSPDGRYYTDGSYVLPVAMRALDDDRVVLVYRLLVPQQKPPTFPVGTAPAWWLGVFPYR